HTPHTPHTSSNTNTHAPQHKHSLLAHSRAITHTHTITQSHTQTHTQSQSQKLLESRPETQYEDLSSATPVHSAVIPQYATDAPAHTSITHMASLEPLNTPLILPKAHVIS